MKLIDVLVKLANDEIKEGTKLIINGVEYELNVVDVFYRRSGYTGRFIALSDDTHLSKWFLNLEAELIEVEENAND